MYRDTRADEISTADNVENQCKKTCSIIYTTFNNNNNYLFQTIMYNVFIELNNNNANARCCRDRSKLHSIQ